MFFELENLALIDETNFKSNYLSSYNWYEIILLRPMRMYISELSCIWMESKHG